MTIPTPTTYTSAKLAYLTVEAFAQHFGVSKMTIYRLCHEGAVQWIPVGRSMRIPVAELQRFKRDAEAAAFAEVQAHEDGAA